MMNILLQGILIIAQLSLALPKKDGTSKDVEFRCDNMQVDTKTHTTLCTDNVVLRRGDVLLCCNKLEVHSDHEWNWQTFNCLENVRAKRKNELMWSNKASFHHQKNEIYLTGKPYLKRGASLLTGKKIIIDLSQEAAKVIKPRGTINSTNAEKTKVSHIELPAKLLPEQCPIPSRT